MTLSRRDFLKMSCALVLAAPMLSRHGRAAAQTLASDWPMFRRDLLHTGRATKTSKITVPKERWSVFTRGLVESSAAVGDVDGDGVLEVVVGSYDGNLYAYHGRTGALKWRYETKNWVYSSPAIADADGDGRLEVAIGSQDKSFALLDGRTGRPKWVFLTEDGILSSPAIADIDGDGRMEVVVGSERVYAFDGRTGAVRWKFLPDFPARSSPLLQILTATAK
jgi:outer membrane protein assembly factor BamB